MARSAPTPSRDHYMMKSGRPAFMAELYSRATDTDPTSAQCLAGFAVLGVLLLLGTGTEPAIMAPPSPYNVSSGLFAFDDMLHSHSALQSDFDLGRLRGTLAHDALGAIGGLMQARTGQPLCFSRLPPSPPRHNAGLSSPSQRQSTCESDDASYHQRMPHRQDSAFARFLGRTTPLSLKMGTQCGLMTPRS